MGSSALDAASEPSRQPLGFREVYDRWFDPVGRWLAAQGVPDSEIDDAAQEVFLVVQRRLPGFDGRNLPGWLFRISANVARDHRRRAWFRHLFLRRSLDDAAEAPASAPGPAELLEAKEDRRLLDRLLARLTPRRRTALVLFEIDGYSHEEIGALLGIPSVTVRSRVSQARKDFVRLVRSLPSERT